MHLVIRADASIEIGAGHVMRCLSLADAFSRHGGAVSFVMRDLAGNLASVARAAGHNVELVPAAEPPIFDQDVDAAATMSILEKTTEPQWLVVDHYSIDQSWEARLRHAGYRLMIIGGPPDRAHQADILHDQTFAKNPEARWTHLVPPHCLLLLGPRYALLRPEFVRLRGGRRQSPTVERIFVSLGGSDPLNLSNAVLEALAGIPGEFNVDLVLGPQYRHQLRISTSVATLWPRVHVHRAPANIAEIMVNSQIAITGGGISVLECLCLGIPCIAVAAHSNQRTALRELGPSGYCTVIPWDGRESRTHLAGAVLAFLQNRLVRRDQGARGMSLVDGRGADRVVDHLL